MEKYIKSLKDITGSRYYGLGFAQGGYWWYNTGNFTVDINDPLNVIDADFGWLQSETNRPPIHFFKLIKVSNGYKIVDVSSSTEAYVSLTKPADDESGVRFFNDYTFKKFKLEKTGKSFKNIFRNPYLSWLDLDKPGHEDTFFLYDDPKGLSAFNSCILMCRMITVPITVSKYGKATCTLPYGVRLPKDKRNEFKLSVIKKINHKLYLQDISNIGVPAFTGFIIEYIGTDTENSHTVNLIIDDSVGAPLTDNILRPAAIEINGLPSASGSFFLLGVSSGKASFLPNGENFTVAPANKAYILKEDIEDCKDMGFYSTSSLDKEYLDTLSGSFSNNLSKAAGTTIHIETLVDSAETDDDKEKIKNYAAWHITRVIDNSNVDPSLGGKYTSDSEESALTCGIKDL